MRLVSPAMISGDLVVPPSKSAMQRALFAALLCPPDRGESIIFNPSDSADVSAARQIVEALGGRVREGSKSTAEGEESAWFVNGGDTPKTRRVSCGEAGLSFRCAISLCARLEGEFEVIADGTLRNRPLPDVGRVFESLGATYRASEKGKPPLFVRGPLLGGRAEVDGAMTSQFLSGLLMVLPTCPNDSEVTVTNLVSAPYVQMTLQTLEQFGVQLEVSADLSVFRIPGNQLYQPATVRIEGDWSSASVLLSLAAICGPVTFHGLTENSKQADRQIVNVLRSAGAGLAFTDAAVKVQPATLRSFDFDATNCPDLIPALVVLAASCAGTSAIHGASRLVGKESNRAQVLTEQGQAVGLDIAWDGDRLLIVGGKKLRGGRVETYQDHRMAMAFAALGVISETGIQVMGSECVAKSYPSFFEDLSHLMVRE